MNTIPNRLVVYAKDVMNITGRKERTAQKLLAQIRSHYGKSKNEFVTLAEFCDYTGLRKTEVIHYLK